MPNRASAVASSLGFALTLAAPTAWSQTPPAPPDHHLFALEPMSTALGPSASGSTVLSLRYAYAHPVLRYVGGDPIQGGVVQEWDVSGGVSIRGTIPVAGTGGAFGGAGRFGFRGVIGRTNWLARVALQFDVGFGAMAHWALAGSNATALYGPETGIGIGPWFEVGPLALAILAQARMQFLFGWQAMQPELLAGVAFQVEYTRTP